LELELPHSWWKDHGSFYTLFAKFSMDPYVEAEMVDTITHHMHC
jgi:hypothetical protein